MIVTAACPTELSAQGLMPLAAQPHRAQGSRVLLPLREPAHSRDALHVRDTIDFYRGSAHTSTRLEWSYCRVVTMTNRVGAIVSQRYHIQTPSVVVITMYMPHRR